MRARNLSPSPPLGAERVEVRASRTRPTFSRSFHTDRRARNRPLMVPMKACPARPPARPGVGGRHHPKRRSGSHSYEQARGRIFNAIPRPRIPAANTTVEAGSGTAVVEEPTGVTSQLPVAYFWTGGGSYPVTKKVPVPANPMLYTAPELVVMVVYSPDPHPTSKWDTAALPEFVWYKEVVPS
jgi:hypothetical protein